MMLSNIAVLVGAPIYEPNVAMLGLIFLES